MFCGLRTSIVKESEVVGFKRQIADAMIAPKALKRNSAEVRIHAALQ